MNTRQICTLALITTALLVGGVLTGPAVAQNDTQPTQPEDEPAFIVEIDQNGNATMTVVLTYSLDNEDQRAGFERLQEDEELRENTSDNFQNRFGAVAATASQAVNRSMSVSDADIEIQTVDQTGVVSQSLTWTALAGMSDGDLVVTEPFNSGFSLEQDFYVIIPQEHGVTSVTPEPTERENRQLIWSSGTDLTGFELVISPVDEGDDSDEMDDGDDTNEGDSDEMDDGDDTNEGDSDEMDDGDDTNEGDSDEMDDGDDTNEGDSDEMDDGDDTNEGDGDEDDEADASGPGFGVVAAVTGLLTATLLLSRRQ